MLISGDGASGPVTTYWCDIGTIGTRTPAIRPISAAKMPPQFTTISASMSPRSVLTPVTRPSRVEMASTLVCCRMLTPPARAPAASE